MDLLYFEKILAGVVAGRSDDLCVGVKSQVEEGLGGISLDLFLVRFGVAPFGGTTMVRDGTRQMVHRRCQATLRPSFGAGTVICLGKGVRKDRRL